MKTQPATLNLSFRSLDDAWEVYHDNPYVIQLSTKKGKVPFAEIQWQGGRKVSPEVKILAAAAWTRIGRRVVHAVNVDANHCVIVLYAVDNGKLYRDTAEDVVAAYMRALYVEREKLLGIPAPNTEAGSSTPASDGADTPVPVQRRSIHNGVSPARALSRDYRSWDDPLWGYR